MKKHKMVSLFAGIGGFDLAFEQEGFDIAWANEIDKFACQTYRENFPSHELIEGDIRKIDVKDIPPHDVLTAGFPCQPFSLAQQGKKGLEHKSGNLFYEIVRVLKHHKPDCFLLENVRGLIFKNNREVFKLILKELESCGYVVQWKILNAKDFGVPQNRERIFLFGSSIPFNIFQFPEPTYQPTKLSDVLEKKVDQKYYLSEKALQGFQIRKERLGEENKLKGRACSVFTPDSNYSATMCSRYWKNGSEILLKEDIVYQWRRNYLRENKSNVVPTLTSNMGTGGNNVPLINQVQKLGFVNKNIQGNKVYDPNGLSITMTANSGGLFPSTGAYLIENRIRKLTPRECARLMGFPDSFKIVCSNSQTYKQFGNSVVVPLVRKLVQQIKQALHEQK